MAFLCTIVVSKEQFLLRQGGCDPLLAGNLVKKANDPSNHVSITASTTLGCTPCNRCSVYNIPKFTFMHNCNETEQEMAALTQMHEIRLLWFGLYTIFAGQNIWQTHFLLRHHCQCQSQSCESRAPHYLSQDTLNLLLSACVLYAFTKKKTPVIFLHNINVLYFIVVTGCILSRVEGEFLCIIFDVYQPLTFWRNVGTWVGTLLLKQFYFQLQY